MVLSPAQTGDILLSGPGTWRPGAAALCLREPERVLVAQDPAEVPGLLNAVQQACAQGLVVAGYVSYEAGAAYGLQTHPPNHLVPLAWMACYDPAQVTEPAAAELLGGAVYPNLAGVEVELNVSREQYEQAILAIKEYIAAGDTYQVNYTCHGRFALDVDPLGYFLALVASHPVPYGAYLNLGEAQVLSLSPELFLQRRGDVLESRPMKGTRRRGRTAEEDRALAEELVASLKDRAENLMILDMVRNDLGRVCEIGSIHAPAMFTAEKYRTVWQMTSTVHGRVRSEASLSDLFAATFPGASITGAPKRRTMEIIHELEPEPRGLYTGAVCLFEPSGDFTCNLPIRTPIHREGQFDLGIGAGILWDSLPQSEYEETLLKSHFAFRMLPDFRLFETLLLDENAKYLWLEEHLRRLAESAEYWELPWDEAAARARLAEVPGPAVVRLELLQDGTLELHARAVPEPPAQPVRVLVSDRTQDSINRLLYHKTNQRAVYDSERAQATAEGYFDVLFTNERGHVTEGAITNVFAKIGEQWVTPPVMDGLLPGLWRAHMIEELSAQERSLTVAELQAAEQVLAGNSVRGTIEVAEVVAP